MTGPRREVAQIVTRFMAGAGGVALRGAASLDPNRYHVTIVTGQGGRLLDDARAAGMSVVVEPTLVPELSPRHDVMALRRLTALCREREFDVVHTHSAKAGTIGRLAAHRSGVPTIVHTFHGFPFHDFQSRSRRSAYIAIERRMGKITDVVLAIGGGVATEALRRGFAHPARLRTIAPVVDEQSVVQTEATRAEARALLGLPAGRPVIGTVGRLDFQKAPEHFVSMVEALRHREVVAVWVGSGPQFAEVEGLLRSKGLTGRVRLVGERTDVPSLLPAFDVFVMTSRYEGLPCAVVEAMRAGLPVVATAVNSVPDLVIPGESGLLVPPAAPTLCAEAIDYLLDRPEIAARLARRGREMASVGFDASGLGAVLDEIYGGSATFQRLAQTMAGGN